MIAKESAYDVIARYGSRCPGLRVGDLCRAMGIAAKQTEPNELKTCGGGLAFHNESTGRMYVFVDPAYSDSEIRFTAAHELGHVVLGHIGTWTTTDGRQIVGRKCDEQEADVFADELLRLIELSPTT